MHHCHYYEQGGIATLILVALAEELPPSSKKSQSSNSKDWQFSEADPYTEFHKAHANLGACTVHSKRKENLKLFLICVFYDDAQAIYIIQERVNIPE